MFKRIAGMALVAAVGLTPVAASAATLDDVKQNGFLRCGVSEGTVGFAVPEGNPPTWKGLDVDICRAIASAILNDPQAVRFVPTTSENRWQTLSSGEVDLLSRTSTWTMTRDTTLGAKFVTTTYYDGQGFMVRKDTGITSASELGGATLCIESGTTTELNAADFYAFNGMEYSPVTFVSQAEAYKAYEDGRCDAFTTDRSALAGNRLELAVPDDHVVLPEVISKEPLSTVVRQGDDQWFNIVRWTHYALLEAEELGVTQANVDEMLGSDNPAIRRLLGVEGDFGTPMGLTKEWAYQAIKGTGNYAEIFDRNVGAGSPVGLARGANALWNDGGLQYSPPIR